MKTPLFAAILLILPAVFSVYADVENLPGVESSLFEEIDDSREAWEAMEQRYMESMTTAMKRLKEEKDARMKKLVEEELPREEREALHAEIRVLEKRHADLDDEENMLQAASIVKWANRKAEVEQFLTFSKKAIAGASGLAEGP